ncbi:uncharacterized protein K452DRAFT_339235 [Aplosporella prunicola CBS 121167]|uniref:BTB domain-containing protein n=1 Tax=Aplosporella prunicola CBS 121167 TaxID=1176127 RepID=A0A6A6B497_9PEZI|nr:uncharacterized protein K452DRAFT_339235 [Aplosporella prunicola CBS 121167]KAF2138044.1 hypothetical protein K452DRAFT_339235 [Aplosporella prunicola CBS 121167]
MAQTNGNVNGVHKSSGSDMVTIKVVGEQRGTQEFSVKKDLIRGTCQYFYEVYFDAKYTQKPLEIGGFSPYVFGWFIHWVNTRQIDVYNSVYDFLDLYHLANEFDVNQLRVDIMAEYHQRITQRYCVDEDATEVFKVLPETSSFCAYMKALLVPENYWNKDDAPRNGRLHKNAEKLIDAAPKTVIASIVASHLDKRNNEIRLSYLENKSKWPMSDVEKGIIERDLLLEKSKKAAEADDDEVLELLGSASLKKLKKMMHWHTRSEDSRDRTDAGK